MPLSHLLAFTALLLTVSQTCQAVSYVAEGYFVVDDKTVERYQSLYRSNTFYAVSKIQEDMDYKVGEINQMFKTLSAHGLDLQIRVRAKTILTTPASSLTTIGNLRSSAALFNFATWLNDGNKFNSLGYDFAILWTGHNLVDSSGDDILGTAFLGKVCDSVKNIGVVEFNGTFVSVEMTAKMIAHILGANSDGAASQYVMAPRASALHTQRWSFSSNSASQIQTFIGTLRSNCLLVTNPRSVLPSVSYASYSGDMFNPDVVCRRRFYQQNSYMCRASKFYGNDFPVGDKVCQTIYCNVPEVNKCFPTYPSDGQVCDCGKRCQDGICKIDRSAPRLTDCNCLFGDDSRITILDVQFVGSCSQLVARFTKRACYNSGVEQRCCDTCNSLDSGLQGCHYGDRSSKCTTYSRAVVCPNNREVCCDYCRNYREKRDVGVGGGDGEVAVPIDDVVVADVDDEVGVDDVDVVV